MADLNKRGKELRWIVSKLDENQLHPRKCRELKDLLQNSEKMIQLGLEAQKTILIGLIDQLAKDFDCLPPMEEAPKVIAAPTKSRKDDLLPKLKCSLCEQSNFDVVGYRKHLKESHKLIFLGY